MFNYLLVAIAVLNEPLRLSHGGWSTHLTTTNADLQQFKFPQTQEAP